MTYDPFNAPAQKFEPEPPVRLYELERGAETFRAEFRWRGEFGAELQLYRNGEFVFGRLYEERHPGRASGREVTANNMKSATGRPNYHE